MAGSKTDSLLRSAQQHHQAGRLREAEEAYRQVLLNVPNHPRTLFMLGAIAHQSGDIPSAHDWLVKAAAADPSFAETHFLLGIIAHKNGQLQPAIQEYRKVISLQPLHIKALNNLGRALLDLGQIAEGKQILHRAIALAPRHASAHSNLGDAFRLSRDFDSAIVEYQHAIAIDPNFAEAHSNLGAALAERGDVGRGIASLQTALSINPRLATVHCNLARALYEQNRFDEAMQHCRITLELRPDYADGHHLLGNLLGISGRVPEAITAQRQAIALKPNHSGSGSNLLLSLHHLEDMNPADIFQAHLDWAARYASNLIRTGLAYENDRNPDRKLRIGYLSPNLQHHSVAYFLLAVLNAHNHSLFEIFCYADVARPDGFTQRLRAAADQWRDIADQPDSAVFESIRRDKIDVLIDLAGHTADNRMSLFAMKPAPVQITWLGYPATTGLSTMDYRVTDSIADPPGQSESLHTEKLLRLEGGTWAYTPPADSPPVGPLPFLTNGYITFGSFNNLRKITPRVLQTWARIMLAVPGSRLLLKALGLSGTAGRNYCLDHLTRHGIDPARIELLGWAPNTSSHLYLYNRVDIALDTFPYNGTTTTCEALWMGVPVLTFPGQTHTARVGASLLTFAAYPELIATDIENYVTSATQLANDQPRLIEFRTSLRSTFANSPVCDGPRVARQLEEAFRRAWKIWLALPV